MKIIFFLRDHLLSVLGVSLALLASAATWMQYQSLMATARIEVQAVGERLPPKPSVVYDRHGNRIGQFGSHQFQPVTLNDLPPQVWQAFVSAEDRKFFTHRGICLLSVVRAGFANFKARRWVQGASTITQQLIRMHLLSREKKISRKLREAFLALALEDLYSKEEILEMYLNSVFFGYGVYGIAAAAQHYFHMSVEELGWSEASLLAGLIRAPSRYDLYSDHGWKLARQRQNYVLRRLVADQILDEVDAKSSFSKEPKLARLSPSLGEFGYAMFTVRQEIERLVQGLNWKEGGYRIETGLDIRALRRVQGAASELSNVEGFQGFDGELAVLVMEANSGDILAIVGGQNFHNSQFNRAVQMRRPIGAIALPLIYAKALAHGFQLGDRLYSLQRESPDPHDPTLFDGLLQGMQMESTRLGVELGLGSLRSYFHQLGWQTDREDFDLILGLKNLSPLQVSAAYAALTNGGDFVEPRLVRAISDRHGKTVLRVGPSRKRVLPYEAAFAMSRALQTFQSLTRSSRIEHEDEIGGYYAVGPARQNFWQVFFDDNLVLTTWVGSDSGRQALPSRRIWDPGQSSRDFYRILVDEAKILDTMNLKEPSGIRYHGVETLTFRGQKVFLPFTTRTRW